MVKKSFWLTESQAKWIEKKKMYGNSYKTESELMRVILNNF